MHIKNERRCVACRNNKPQFEMIRIAKIDKNFVIDETNKLGGRGAYVCKNKECLSKTVQKHLLNKAFKTNIDLSVYEKLGEYEQNN